LRLPVPATSNPNLPTALTIRAIALCYQSLATGSLCLTSGSPAPARLTYKRSSS